MVGAKGKLQLTAIGIVSPFLDFYQLNIHTSIRSSQATVARQQVMNCCWSNVRRTRLGGVAPEFS